MNQSKLQDQRDTWLRARAAERERQRERDEGIARLNGSLERAKARADAEYEALQKMVAATLNEAEDYLKPPSEREAETASETIAKQEGRRELQDGGKVSAEGVSGPGADVPDTPAGIGPVERDDNVKQPGRSEPADDREPVAPVTEDAPKPVDIGEGTMTAYEAARAEPIRAKKDPTIPRPFMGFGGSKPRSFA